MLLLKSFGKKRFMFWGVEINNVLVYFFVGIDGRVDMKLICGITVAEEKGKVGKDGKVRNGYL